jgi:hypothetical protein
LVWHQAESSLAILPKRIVVANDSAIDREIVEFSLGKYFPFNGPENILADNLDGFIGLPRWQGELLNISSLVSISQPSKQGLRDVRWGFAQKRSTYGFSDERRALSVVLEDYLSGAVLYDFVAKVLVYKLMALEGNENPRTLGANKSLPLSLYSLEGARSVPALWWELFLQKFSFLRFAAAEQPPNNLATVLVPNFFFKMRGLCA